MKNRRPTKILVTVEKSEEEIKKEDEAIINKVKKLKLKSMNDATLVLYRSSFKNNYSNIKSRFRIKTNHFLLDLATKRQQFGNSAFSHHDSIIYQLNSRTISPMSSIERIPSKKINNIFVIKPKTHMRNYFSPNANRQNTMKPKLLSFLNKNDFYY